MDNIEVAINYIYDGEMEKALHLLEKLEKNKNINTKLDIAQLYLELGIEDRASELLKEIINKEPSHNEAKLMLADILVNDNEDEKAISILNEIEPHDELYIHALLQLADLYQAQGLFEVAEKKLYDAKQLRSDEPLIDFALGEFFFSVGEYHKSTIYFEKLLEHTHEIAGVDIDLRLAESYALNGEFEEALTYFQNSDTNDPEQLFRYGFLAYQAERYEIAIEVWKQLLENEMEFPSVYQYLTISYDQEGLLAEAVTTARKGVEMDPYNKEMWYIAGKILHKNSEQNVAYEYMEKAIALDSEYYEALLFLIECYKNDQNYSSLIELLTTKVEINELDGIFTWELAKAYNEEEQYNESLNAYQNAYNKLNKDVDFLQDYGYFLVEEGKIQSAIQILEEYLQYEPSDFEVEQYVNRLKEQIDTL
ncbi:tetratricopeptide repeat protein [Gracilibacillus marinus]|jgi:tetratricopeptide (TPR) repeat protein|uniref:Tetratricopeptide repeat protein n=1 Tax=Gracilibacillus marinus TaxID=630535 RepID=A0ABV8VTY1_9BACI